MFKKINRLTKKKDIEALMKQGKAVYFLLFIIKYRPNNLNLSRFAVIVSSRVSKKAVKRNLAKRRIREVIRLNLPKIEKGFDIAIIVSPKIIDQTGRVAKYKELEKTLLSAFKKAQLI